MSALPRTARPLVPLLLLLALAGLAGCSSPGTSSSSVASGATTTGGRAGAQAAAGQAAPAVAGQAVAAPADLSLGRSVVRTATSTVQVTDVRSAAARARDAAVAAGGGLEAEDASAGTDVLRLRVAPERLSGALDSLARLGTETARTITSEDVTGQVADVESRLATQRASVERVRALLDKAQVLADVVTLEGQLTQREGDLESLEARAKALQATADLATVTLTLTTVPDPPARTHRATFGSGLAAALTALLGSARVAAVVAGALLPFVPLVVLAAWLVRRRLRPTPPVEPLSAR